SAAQGRSRLDAWRYLRDARRTGRDYRITGRGLGTHRPARGSGTNRDNARRSSKGGAEHRPLGAGDTRRPDSELARSDQRPDVAIVRPFLCSMSDRVSSATVYLELANRAQRRAHCLPRTADDNVERPERIAGAGSVYLRWAIASNVRRAPRGDLAHASTRAEIRRHLSQCP